MKDIFTILAENNVSVPDEVKDAITSAVNENYKTIAEVNKITTARDNYKSQLETAQTALKEFEGVDVKELQGRITTLQDDLAAKDKEYQDKLDDIDFNSDLESGITAAKAKNAKAVKALLDLETLKKSKNRAEDIKNAINSVKTDNDYLFDSDEPFKNPVKNTGNTTITGGSYDLMREAMGLPAEKKGE